MKNMIGKKIGKYKITEVLGQGGMGVVYKGLHTTLNMPVAIKMLLDVSTAADPKAIERFKMEALTIANLNHPNIVKIHDTEEIEGSHFIIMEFVEGEDLSSILKDKTKSLSKQDKLKIIFQVASALAEAHEKDIIHRDIKPANIIITKKGLAKLMDFGISKMKDSGLQTMTGTSYGTPRYMSPEQIEGKDIDTRADIYSFGILCYELFTGTTPFKGDDPFAVAMMHLNKTIPKPSTINKDIDPAVEKLILLMLHKDRAKRLASLSDLEKVFNELKQTRSESMEDLATLAVTIQSKAKSKIAGRKVMAMAAGVCIVVGLTFAGIGVYSGKIPLFTKDSPVPAVGTTTENIAQKPVPQNQQIAKTETADINAAVDEAVKQPVAAQKAELVSGTGGYINNKTIKPAEDGRLVVSERPAAAGESKGKSVAMVFEPDAVNPQVGGQTVAQVIQHQPATYTSVPQEAVQPVQRPQRTRTRPPIKPAKPAPLRVIVQVTEYVDGLYREDAMAAGAIESLMADSGARVLDIATLEKVKERDMTILYKDPAAGAALGKRHGADIVITGSVSSDKLESRSPYGLAVFRYHGTANLKAIKVDTAEVIKNVSKEKDAWGSGEVPTAQKAAKEVVAEACAELQNAIKTMREKEFDEVRLIEVIVHTPEKYVFDEFLYALQDIESVTDVAERSYSEGVGVSECSMPATVYSSLDATLDKIDDFTITVIGKTANRIDLEVAFNEQPKTE